MRAEQIVMKDLNNDAWLTFFHFVIIILKIEPLIW